jgi:hypothetical protein
MKNKNLPLIIGIALPVLFIGIVSIILFLPSLFIRPQHNFIYSSNNDYYSYNQAYRNSYAVENGRLIMEPLPVQAGVVYTYKADAPDLFLYDVKSDSSHLIEYSEARRWNLDPGPSSPDGYTVKYEYGHDGIFELFGSDGRDNGYFISKGSGSKKLRGLGNNGYYDSGNFKLIGWVK